MVRQLRASVLSVLIFTLVTGILFPAAIYAIGQAVFPGQANGSLVVRNGRVVGSSLIAQSFAAPAYFHPRPSAAGSGYDPLNSGGTNLGPTSDKLINGVHRKLSNGQPDPSNFDGIRDLAVAYRKENDLPASTQLPADAVTRSASGLDPDISAANAAFQAGRVAGARGVSIAVVEQIIAQNSSGKVLGLIGEPRANVLQLNLALDRDCPVAHAGSPPR